MEDQGIIRLYFNRDQEAIRQTDRKYGRQCRRTARNILAIPEDAEECVNDTYLAAWNTIPPERPRTLGAYLGRIIRNLSISRYRANHAQKRYAGLEAMLSELEECVPGRADVEAELARIRKEKDEALQQAQEYAGAFVGQGNPDDGDNGGDE